jgi:AraC-like DNA-binding protein
MSAPHVFSTEFLPERDRLPFFKEEFAREMARLDVVPIPDAPFRVDIEARMLGELSCVRLATTPAAYGRDESMLKDGSDHFVLLVNRGPALFDDRMQRMIATGEAILQDTTRKGYVHLQQGGGGLSIAIPRQLLLAHVPAAEDLAARNSIKHPMMTALLARYVEEIMDAGAVDDTMLDAAGSHVLDLLTLGLDDTASRDRHAHRNGLRATRWALVRRRVRDGLRNPALSLAGIARSEGVSERYVQLLFQEQGTSFTDYVQEQRLELARRELSNPSKRHLLVSEIAKACGFGDLSHFNRSYRRRFGETPSDTRADER